MLPEHICFHAQQAAEKSLKAALLARRIDFPLTHDLDELVEIAENAGLHVPEPVDDVGMLTPYAVALRYPGPWEDVTDEEVDDALTMARNVVAWASRLVSESG